MKDRRYIDIESSVWKLCLADISGTGEKVLVCGCVDGIVRCIQTDSEKIVWEFNTSSFIYSMAVGDCDNDGKDEIFIVTVEGILYALDQDGRFLWQFKSLQALHDVVFARVGEERYILCGGIDRNLYLLSPQGKIVSSDKVSRLVSRLASGDIDGDGNDEIFVTDGARAANGARWYKIKDGQLHLMHEYPVKYPALNNSIKKQGDDVRIYSANIIPPAGERKGRILIGDACTPFYSILCLDIHGKVQYATRLNPSFAKKNTWHEVYATCFVRSVNIEEMPEVAAVAVAAGSVYIIGHDGSVISVVHTRPGFSDVVMDGSTMYLGSTPSGDTCIYRIDLLEDYETQIQSLTFQGKAKAIYNNLHSLLDAVKNCKQVSTGAPAKKYRYYQSTHIQGIPNTGDYVGKQKEISDYSYYAKFEQDFNREFPYSVIEPRLYIRIHEQDEPKKPDGTPWCHDYWLKKIQGGAMSREELIRIAEESEALKIPIMFVIGHSCTPFISLETAHELLKAAPNYLCGFITYEDEEIQGRLEDYLTYFMGPLADLCRQYGDKHCITKNKNTWWLSVPAYSKFYNQLFIGERRKAFIPTTEDSNSRTPELNLMARFGLWQVGLAEGLHARTNSDLFSWNRCFQYEFPRMGHCYLRMYVAHTLCGAFEYSAGMSHITDDAGYIPTELGEESEGIFFHMLGKGLVFQPERQQLVGTCTVGIVMHTPSEKWQKDGNNGHKTWEWEPDYELDSAFIPHNGCNWGMTRTPSFSLQAIAFNKKRQFGYNVPPTPYGPVIIVPEHCDYRSVSAVKDWLHTDGTYVWREGEEKLLGSHAEIMVREIFEKSADNLPFRPLGEDVFFQTVKIDDHQYRIYAIDPGWTDPAARDIRIKIQLPGTFILRDILSGEELEIVEGVTKLTIPAGILCIIEAIQVGSIV